MKEKIGVVSHGFDDVTMEVSMNKGSHISLAYYLLDREELSQLKLHKKAFLVGSILPDCLPSFLTTRHTITETYNLLQSEIRKISKSYHKNRGISNYFCIHLGIIMHYLADYFTMPHNPGYYGSVKGHVEYEKELWISIRRYIEEEACYMKQEMVIEEGFICLNNQDDIHKNLSEYLLLLHKEYQSEVQDLLTDCKYIVKVCYTAALALVRYLSRDQLPQELAREYVA